MVMTFRWRSVQLELPIDNVPVLVFGKYNIDNSDCYEVSTFRRSIGWDVAHFVDVLMWCEFEPVPSSVEDTSEKEEKPEPPPSFNKWFNPGE